MKIKMNAKNILVSFLIVASVLLLVSTVSAFTITGNLADNVEIKINGIDVSTSAPAVIAGETITVKVNFDSLEDVSRVTVKAELEDFVAKTGKFVTETNNRYSKTLTLRVPYDFEDDEVSRNMNLEIEITGEDTETGEDYKTEVEGLDLKVQRSPYEIEFKSITMSNSIEAGETFPVDFVLKNTGYNDLEDIYLTVRISGLNLEKTLYFGDLVAIEDPDDDDDTDTISGRIYLQLPYDVEPGIYTLEVEASNDDMNVNEVKQVIIKNSLVETVIKSNSDLIIVNPTDRVKVYKLISDAPITVSESIVVVPAGSSRKVTVSPNTAEYDFDISVFSGEELVGTVNFSGTAQEEEIASPIVVLTVILAIIFLVLLIVLIVLVTKKPEKTEEFGESYY